MNNSLKNLFSILYIDNEKNSKIEDLLINRSKQRKQRDGKEGECPNPGW